MNQKETIINENNGAQIKVKPGGTCKLAGVIYAINCKKCKQIYIGHTGQTIAARWSKQKYDIVNRPEQNELTKHCCRDHNIERDLEVIILDIGCQAGCRMSGKGWRIDTSAGCRHTISTRAE